MHAFKRGIFSTREIRLCSLAPQSAGEEVTVATQQWVHVDASLKPVRASAELVEAFPPLDRAEQDPGAMMPETIHEERSEAPTHESHDRAVVHMDGPFGSCEPSAVRRLLRRGDLLRA